MNYCHGYIIGGPRKYKACCELGEKEPVDLKAQEYYLMHNIIPVFAKDADTLIKVSNALYIEVKDKVVEANYQSYLEWMRAKWIEEGKIDKRADPKRWKVN